MYHFYQLCFRRSCLAKDITCYKPPLPDRLGTHRLILGGGGGGGGVSVAFVSDGDIFHKSLNKLI